MDNNEIEDVVQNVRRYFDHDSAKKILKEKYEAKMYFAAFGGMWKAGAELLAVLQVTNKSKIVIIDEYGNPCEVSRAELFEQVQERWQEQMNGWYNEYIEMQKQR